VAGEQRQDGSLRCGFSKLVLDVWRRCDLLPNYFGHLFVCDVYAQIADVILRVTNALMNLSQKLMTSSHVLRKACTRYDNLHIEITIDSFVPNEVVLLVHRVTMTSFRSLSTPADFRRHLVGKALIDVHCCDIT